MLNFFERLTDPYPPVATDASPRTLLRFCLHHANGFKWPIFLISLINAMISILEISLFAFMGNIVDWLGEQDKAQFPHDRLPALLAMGAVLLVCLPLLQLLSSLLSNQTLVGNLPMAIRFRMHRHLLAQSLGFYQDEFAGRVATKVMQTALAVRELVLKLIHVLVYVGVYFVSMLVLLGSLERLFLLPVVLWFFTYIVLQCRFIPKLKSVSQAQAHARSTMTGRIVDAYSNISTIKLFAHTRRETDYARDSMDAFMKTVYRQFRFVTQLDVAIKSINYLLIFCVTAMGIFLWRDSLLSAGAVAIAIALTLRINAMSHWVLWEINALFENVGIVSDGMHMLALPAEVRDAPDAEALRISAGGIRFEHVDFSYRRGGGAGGKSLSVIRDLDLVIRPGEKIGLVGPSGAGKSTLVNILLRFYDLRDGRILIDGQDIAKVTQESLRRHIAMVTQDTSLLHRSVRENILYGRPEASEEALQRAIGGAEAADFIATLSDPQGNIGLDAQVGERGVKLSGGQRQRIAIARVLLKDAPILILDEATSALDSEVETAIQESLIRLMAGKTVIAIAHRLSTIAAMDRLVVLDGGRIVEEGSHAALLEKDGIYARLWRHQTGGYLGEAP